MHFVTTILDTICYIWNVNSTRKNYMRGLFFIKIETRYAFRGNESLTSAYIKVSHAQKESCALIFTVSESA